MHIFVFQVVAFSDSNIHCHCEASLLESLIKLPLAETPVNKTMEQWKIRALIKFI